MYNFKYDKEAGECVINVSSPSGRNVGVQNIVLEIKQYQREWLQHVERMGTDRLPKTGTAV
jgi:hypothetical protein